MEKILYFLKRKNYHLAESIYNGEYDLLINQNKYYLMSNYEYKAENIKKIHSKHFKKKNNFLKFEKKNKIIKKLDIIEKHHIKKGKLNLDE